MMIRGDIELRAVHVQQLRISCATCVGRCACNEAEAAYHRGACSQYEQSLTESA